MPETIKIQNISVEPGQKVFKFLNIARTPLKNVDMPLGIINGAENGPCLAITAGIHPTEYPGIEAAIRTFQQFELDELKGTLLIVPVINTPGFETRSAYVCPIDGLNLNRYFPGNPEGTVGLRILHILFNDVILNAQYHLDLHGGDLPEDLTQFAIYGRYGKDKSVDDAAEGMAKAYSPKIVWNHTGAPGTSHQEATMKSIPSVTGEAEGLGLCREENVKFHFDGIQNVLKYLEMIDGTPVTSNTRIFDDWWGVLTQQNGVFHPDAKPGDEISKGDVLGFMKDLQGTITEELIAPANGLIRIYFPYRVKNSGEFTYKAFTTD